MIHIPVLFFSSRLQFFCTYVTYSYSGVVKYLNTTQENFFFFFFFRFRKILKCSIYLKRSGHNHFFFFFRLQKRTFFLDIVQRT